MTYTREELNKSALSIKKWLIEVRHYLHKYPELSFEEYNTQKYITQELQKIGVENIKNIADTGVVAEINGDTKGSCIALRADMDALPIQELNNIEYKSVNPGIMHACGHDVHMACLLGTIKLLNKIKSSIKGRVLFVFQPGEEKLPGGANKIIESGIFDEYNPRLILAQHVMPNMPVGTLGFRSGEYMASTDEIYITIKGNGGHIAVPNLTKDVVSAAAECIISIKEDIINQAGNIPIILGFGKITANGSNNIIPNQVKISGTFRTMDEQFREYAKKQIKIKLERIVQSYGATAELSIVKGYPSLKNHSEYTNDAISYATDLLNSDKIIELDKRMTGEDFAYYSRIIPSVFYRLGIASDNAGNNNVHNPYFNIDEDALVYGSMGMTWLSLNFLNNFNN